MASPQDVKQEFIANGVTIREWAQQNGFSEALVYAVLNGKNQATRGESYKIALALGLKTRPERASGFILSVLDKCATESEVGMPQPFPSAKRSEYQMT